MRFSGFIAAAIIFLAGSATQTMAGVIVDSHSFEQPDYSAGPLVGQNGFESLGGISAGGPQVKSGVAYTGSQAVRVVGSDIEPYQDFYAGFWHVPIGRDPVAEGFDIIRASVAIRMDVVSTDSLTANLQLYGTDVADYFGGAYIWGDGSITFDTAADSKIVGTAEFGRWYQFGVEVNFSTGLATGYLDGVQVSSLALGNLVSTSFDAAEMSVASVAPLTVDDVFYFDDYKVEFLHAVPEPSSLALAMSGATVLALVSRRRIKSRR
ncbi:MAG: PEP-CTERM sorting domain-containing protein [Isosphaeraceae bacterium]